MNKGMDEEYFEEIKRIQMNLPQVSIINVAPDIFFNVVKGYSLDTIKGIINLINYIEERESGLGQNYHMIRNLAQDEIYNRIYFKTVFIKSLNTYSKRCLN